VKGAWPRCKSKGVDRVGEEEGIGSYTKDRVVRNDRISRLPEHMSQFWRQEEEEAGTRVFVLKWSCQAETKGAEGGIDGFELLKS